MKSNFDNTFGQPSLHIVWNETQSGRMCSFISECLEKSKNLKTQVQLHIQNPIQTKIHLKFWSHKKIETLADFGVTKNVIRCLKCLINHWNSIFRLKLGIWLSENFMTFFTFLILFLTFFYFLGIISDILSLNDSLYLGQVSSDIFLNFLVSFSDICVLGTLIFLNFCDSPLQKFSDIFVF